MTITGSLKRKKAKNFQLTKTFNLYCKVTRSILFNFELFGPKVTDISIKFPFFKQSENPCLIVLLTETVYCLWLGYRISANIFRRNYPFLNLTLSTVTFGHSTYRRWNYSREEIIPGNTVCDFSNFMQWSPFIIPYWIFVIHIIKYKLANC